MNEVDVDAHLEKVGAAGNREVVRELIAVLIREGRTRQRRGFAVGEDIQQGGGRSGRVGAGKLEVAAPGVAELVDLVVGVRGSPVGDEEALVRSAGSVLRSATVIHGGRRVVAVRFLPILPIENQAEVVVTIRLVIELAEKNILLQIAGEGAEVVFSNEGFRIRTRGWVDCSWANESVDGGRRRRRRVENRIHFAETVVGSTEK